MRVAPLAFIVLFVLLVGATVGTTFLWIIAIISVIALCVLIFFMARAKSFVGPRVLADDVRERLESYGRNEPEIESVTPATLVIPQEDKS